MNATGATGPKTLLGLLTTPLKRLNDARERAKAMGWTEEEASLPAVIETAVPAQSWHCPLPPATPKEIIPHLAMLAAVLPSQTASMQTESLRFQVFCIDLAEFPATVVEAACIAYRRDPAHVFFPAPGQLLEECRTQMHVLAYQSGWRREPARLALSAPPPPPLPPPLPIPNLSAPATTENESTWHPAPRPLGKSALSEAAIKAQIAEHRAKLDADDIAVLSRAKVRLRA
jgi:hypothetical protein